MLYSAGPKILSIVLGGGSKDEFAGSLGPLTLLSISKLDEVWTVEQLTVFLENDLIIDELAANDSAIAFTAHKPVIRPNNATRSILYFLDLFSPSFAVQISSGSFGAVFSPALSSNGQIAWLEQRDNGNWGGRKDLWMYDGHTPWKVPFKDWDLSPSRVIVSHEIR